MATLLRKIVDKRENFRLLRCTRTFIEYKNRHIKTTTMISIFRSRLDEEKRYIATAELFSQCRIYDYFADNKIHKNPILADCLLIKQRTSKIKYALHYLKEDQSYRTIVGNDHKLEYTFIYSLRN